jgi:hypothetical protein
MAGILNAGPASRALRLKSIPVAAGAEARPTDSIGWFHKYSDKKCGTAALGCSLAEQALGLFSCTGWKACATNFPL